MNKIIYLIIFGYYSDWQVDGYFTTRDEAEKYVLSCHPSREYSIYEVECLDNQVDLSSISVKYEFSALFRKTNSGWTCHLDDDFDFYQSLYLRSNNIYTIKNADWIRVNVNIYRRDKNLAEKIAQDIFYQYMSECNGRSSEKSMKEFNKILSAEEDARKAAEKEEKLRKKELAELERLKAKYE